MRIVIRSTVLSSLIISGCSGAPDVDYKAAIREDGEGLVISVDDANMAKCKEAMARSPEVARENDPYCRALRMARMCIKDKICP